MDEYYYIVAFTDEKGGVDHYLGNTLDNTVPTIDDPKISVFATDVEAEDALEEHTYGVIDAQVIRVHAGYLDVAALL
jgi:hypothetical protein